MGGAGFLVVGEFAEGRKGVEGIYGFTDLLKVEDEWYGIYGRR